MQFSQTKLKNQFLKKKKQQQKKKQQIQDRQQKATIFQKVIRSFLLRSRLIHNAIENNDLDTLLHFKKIGFSRNLSALPSWINSFPPDSRFNRWIRFIICSLDDFHLLPLSIHQLQADPELILLLKTNLTFLKALRASLLTKLPSQPALCILEVILTATLQSGALFSESAAFLFSFAKDTLEKLLQFLLSQKTPFLLLTIAVLFAVTRLLPSPSFICQNPASLYDTMGIFLRADTSDRIIYHLPNNIPMRKDEYAHSLGYLLLSFIYSLKEEYRRLVKILAPEFQELLNLVSNQSQLQYVEQKIKETQRYHIWEQKNLEAISQIMKNEHIIGLFMEKQNVLLPREHIEKSEIREGLQSFQKAIAQSIEMLGEMFELRKLQFLKKIISKDEILRDMIRGKGLMFFRALLFRIESMNDAQFSNWTCFSQEDYCKIITDILLLGRNYIRAEQELERNSLAYPDGKHPDIRNQLFSERPKSKQQLELLSSLLNTLYKKALRTGKLSENHFVQQSLSITLSNSSNFARDYALYETLYNFPMCFSFESRLAKLKQLIKEDKKLQDRTLFLREDAGPELTIIARRGYEFQDAFQQCMQRNLKQKYRICFYNEQGLEEEGVDGGGILKEFIQRILNQGFNQVSGFFYENSERELIPNCLSHAKAEFEFIGKIIGKAVYEGITLQAKFAEPFLNLFVGRDNNFEDLAGLDQSLYKGLSSLKGIDNRELEAMELNSRIVDVPVPGYPAVEVELFAFQPNTTITREYAELKCNRQLTEKTNFFRRGFLQVMNSQWLKMFTARELSLLVSGGEVDFDVNDLFTNCIYSGGYTQASNPIQLLFTWLASTTKQNKSLFLAFVTSCPRPPTLGFRDLKPLFCIALLGTPDYLPTANTCMNMLRLPPYPTYGLLQAKLQYAIRAKAGFQVA